MERMKKENRFPVPCIPVTTPHAKSVMSVEKQKDICIPWTMDGIHLEAKNGIGTNTVDERESSKTIH